VFLLIPDKYSQPPAFQTFDEWIKTDAGSGRCMTSKWHTLCVSVSCTTSDCKCTVFADALPLFVHYVCQCTMWCLFTAVQIIVTASKHCNHCCHAVCYSWKRITNTIKILSGNVADICAEYSWICLWLTVYGPFLVSRIGWYRMSNLKWQGRGK